MTYSEVVTTKSVNDLFTLVVPSGKNCDNVLVLVDIVASNGMNIPVFRDISRYDPMYLYFSDIVRLFGSDYCCRFNFWDIDDIDSLENHIQLNTETVIQPDIDYFEDEWKSIVTSMNEVTV